MLKLFFGADPSAFALDQADHHAALHAKFSAIRERADAGEIPVSPRHRVVLETGISLHEWWARRWREIAR